MTPIRVPGKNHRDQRRAVLAANSSKKTTKPLGRPPKRLAADSASPLIAGSIKPRTSSKQKSLKHLKSKRKMSALEKLPAELLLQVFLFSLNFDLPRSSPIIAGKISNEHTYIQTMMLIFKPTWDHYEKWNFLGRTPDTLNGTAEIAGDTELQSAMLRCHCATLPRLLKAEDKWLHIYGAPSTRLRAEDAAVEFYENYDEFITWTATDQRFVGNMECQLPLRWNGLVKIHENVKIPDGLLRGPWVSNMTQYLFWLIRAGAGIDWIESTSGEVALSGLRTAITTANVPVLWIFHWLRVSKYMTYEMLTWAKENAGGDQKMQRKIFTQVKNMYTWQHPNDGRVRRF